MISSINQLYNEGDTATLECSSIGGPENMYQWQFNGSNIPGEISPTLVLPSVEGSDGGMYTCVVSNAAGSDNVSTLLYVSPYFITQPVDMLTTNGSSITLLCTAGAFPSPEIHWARADGEIRDEIDTDMPTLLIDSVMFGDEGDYFCIASSQNLTKSSSSATLTGTCINFGDNNNYYGLHFPFPVQFLH